MSKPVFYTIWVSDDSQVDGQNYIVCNRSELVSFIRSGRDFIRIELFNVRTLHEHLFPSQHVNNLTDKESDHE